jgi:hypothetical protein
MSDWRKQVEAFTSEMDTKYDGNLKGSTKRMYFMQTPEGELFRKQRSETTRKRNEETYGRGTYIIRSPGNDLLDFYDEEMLKLDPTSKAFSKIPPSVVYHYRFEHDYPAELFDKSKNYGRNAYLRDQLSEYHQTTDPKDNTYWGQVYSTRFRWLVDTPHKEYKVKYRKDVEKFFKEELGQGAGFSGLKVNDTENASFVKTFWRGNAAGWSIVWVDES